MFRRNDRDRFWMREIERREQAWASERRDLLDRIMFLSGRPWELPTPSFTETPEPDTDFTFPEDEVSLLQ